MVPSVVQLDKIRVVRIATVVLLVVMIGYWAMCLAQGAWLEVAMSPVATSPALLLWFRVETGRL